MPKIIEKNFHADSRIRITFLKSDILHVQIIPRNGEFKDTGLNRYGFIREPDLKGLKIEVIDNNQDLVLKSSRMLVEVNASAGELVITENINNKLILHQIGVEFSVKNTKVRFKAIHGEDWVGFGDQTRKRLYHRGHIADVHVHNVKSYIPVPFFMSTNGAGVLVNTTYRVVFDMCKSDPNYFSWHDGHKMVDYYVMAGNNLKELISLYTELTGKPKLPPEWAFGLWYICRTQANDYEVVNDACNFRREEIPCDILGLEPGWMEEENYDLSIEKTWSRDRFPIPTYCKYGPHNFINAVKRMGFHLELWLCNEYDLSYEAERQLDTQSKENKNKISNGHYHDNAEVDEHFGTPRYLDKFTKRDEPWFEHLKEFIDQGADLFKQDGAYQVVDHPDRVWGNGMLDDEMHNLYPLLYSRQMHEGFEQHAGRRPVVFTVAGWTGFQAWCGTWTGDTGGRLDTLGGMLNISLLGHSWITNDMEVTEKEGIHFGYLQPWSQINSWNYFRMPWAQGEKLCQMHKFYSRLRSRLIPYLYSWAYQATKTGYPVMIPLILEFEGDKTCRDILHQYLLGHDLMVSIYKKEAYFPVGRWKDFWTGDIIEGQKKKAIKWPDNRGGGLYVRMGGIIPFGPVMQYRGQKILDEIELYIFPGPEKSSIELYEDDGTTLRHKSGEYTTTSISTQLFESSVMIKIDSAKGNYDGQVQNRRWYFTIALDSTPSQLRYNNSLLPKDMWIYDKKRKEIRIKHIESPLNLEIKC